MNAEGKRNRVIMYDDVLESIVCASVFRSMSELLVWFYHLLFSFLFLGFRVKEVFGSSWNVGVFLCDMVWYVG